MAIATVSAGTGKGAKAGAAKTKGAAPAKQQGAAAAKPGAPAPAAKVKATHPKATAKATAVELATVMTLLAQIASLTDVQRKAFGGGYTDAQCTAMGAQTKGPLVLKEAITWAKLIQGALVKFAGSLKAYSPARLAWMLECARDLALAIQAQQTSQGDVGGVKAADQQARAAALTVRESLEQQLSMIVGGDDAAMAKVTAAYGTTHDASSIVQALAALAGLAEEWLGSVDAGDQALVASVNLTQGDVDTAKLAATTLTNAASAAIGAKKVVNDAPTVNLAEGRLLFEMKVAKGVFDRAHTVTPGVPKLPSTGGTRRILGKHGKKVAAVAPEVPPGLVQGVGSPQAPGAGVPLVVPAGP